MTFGQQLRSQRRLKGLTLEQVGKRVGASKAYLSGVETDSVAAPAAPVVRKLAKALDLRVFDLMCMAWQPKVPKEIRHLLEVSYASKDQLQPTPAISTEAAAKVFKEVMQDPAPSESWHPTDDPNHARSVASPVEDVPVPPVGGERTGGGLPLL